MDKVQYTGRQAGLRLVCGVPRQAMLGGLECMLGSGGAAAAPYLLQEQPRMIIMHLRTIPAVHTVGPA